MSDFFGDVRFSKVKFIKSQEIEGEKTCRGGEAGGGGGGGGGGEGWNL